MKNEILVLSVVRVPPNARLVVQTAHGRFESIAEVNDPAVRQQLMAAVGELVAFSGGYQSLAEAGVAPNPEHFRAEPHKEEKGLSSQQSAFINSLEHQVNLQGSIKPPVSPVERDGSDEGEDDAAPLLDLAGEIDAILQRNLAHNAALVSRSIHLDSDLDGALRIEVDGIYYQSVDEIEDEQVKGAIARARQEWERR